MWSRICAAAVFNLLAACSPTVKTTCPPLVEYDQAFMDRLATEIDGLPSDSAMVRVVVDYRRLRDLTRACRS